MTLMFECCDATYRSWLWNSFLGQQSHWLLHRQVAPTVVCEAPFGFSSAKISLDLRDITKSPGLGALTPWSPLSAQWREIITENL